MRNVVALLFSLAVIGTAFVAQAEYYDPTFTLKNNSQCVGGTLVLEYSDVSDTGASVAAKDQATLDCQWLMTGPGQCCSVQYRRGTPAPPAIGSHVWMYQIYSGATVGSVVPPQSTPTNTYQRWAGIAGAQNACSGTYELDYSDLSDVSCPITTSLNNLNIYKAVPTCPGGNAPQPGTQCTGPCKVNTLTQMSGCVVQTDVYTCKGSDGQPVSGSCIAPATVTASLVANPNSIFRGDSSLLTWSSSGATQCTSSNFATGGNVSGSVAVSPTAETKYTVTCTGPGGSATASATILVATPDPAEPADFSVSCRAHPTKAGVGEDVLWSSTVAGPAGTYTYSWSGTDNLTGTGNQAFKKYYTSGRKTASLAVTFTPGTAAAPTAPTSQTSSGQYAYVPKGSPYFTKICSGGTNTTSIQEPTCGEGTSCTASDVGKICKTHGYDEGGCEMTIVQTGDGPLPGPTLYGYVQNYECKLVTGTPAPVNPPLLTVPPAAACPAIAWATPITPCGGTWSPTYGTDGCQSGWQCVGGAGATGGGAILPVQDSPSLVESFIDLFNIEPRDSQRMPSPQDVDPTSFFMPKIAHASTPACTETINNNQWYTGAEIVPIASEGTLTPISCAMEAKNAGYPFWNRSVENRCPGTGVPCEYDPARTTCYGVRNPTGLVAKPEQNPLGGYPVHFDSGDVCEAGGTSGGGQCSAGQTSTPTFNVAGASCTGGTVIGRTTEMLDAVQIGMWPDGWIAEQCSELGAVSGDCCEYSQRASNVIGGGFPPNSYYQITVVRGGSFSQNDSAYIQTPMCSGSNLSYSCSSVAGSVGTQCGGVTPPPGGQCAIQSTKQDAKCSGGTQLGSVTYEEYPDQCHTYCSGLNAACCTHLTETVTDPKSPGEPTTFHTCTAWSGTATTAAQPTFSNVPIGPNIPPRFTGTYRSTSEASLLSCGTGSITKVVQCENAVTIVRPQCSDEMDNDGDGKIDFPNDPGCSSPDDDLELDGPAECSDGIDNDGDGDTDAQDPGCNGSGSGYNPDDNSESGAGGNGAAQCSDGIDNNGDGNIDWPDDPGCSSADDNLEFVEPSEITFKADPPLIKKNQSCTLTLSAKNVTSCTLSGPGVSRGFTAQNGWISLKEVVTPTLAQTSTYTLSCSGIDGKKASKSVDCKIAPTFEEF